MKYQIKPRYYFPNYTNIIYSETHRIESSGDDAGYESLHNNHPSSQSSLIRNHNPQHEPRYAALGIDSRKNFFMLKFIWVVFI